MTPDIFTHKINRLATGYRPRVLDLFAGCGGISLGFHTAGFKLEAAIELDSLAAESHANNFYKHCDLDTRHRHAQARDIVDVSPVDFIREYSSERPEQAIDVIVGGPPCQAFARVGRAKLREVAEHPEAFLQDSRSNLYLQYLKFVHDLKPLALLMENVPDMLNFGGHNIAEEMCEALEEFGYSCAYTLLNSVHYGVPEMRERVFLLAYTNELSVDQILFPAPTHHHVLPSGYEGSRRVALKNINDKGQSRFSFSETTTRFIQPPPPPWRLSPVVTANDALQDLPRITLHLEGKLKRGARRFDTLVPYPSEIKPTAYGELMRDWAEFENNIGIKDHVIRYLPRDYAIFARMNPGDQYPQAFAHAQDLFAEKLFEIKRKNIFPPEKGTEEYEALWKATVPPYDPKKFPNKWRKMEADAPARTLMAHLGKDGYSHIHYDSSQARTISVREAARLQSFPDGFVFSGTMNPAFRQIGNAVPPLVSKAIAEQMLIVLQGAWK